MRYQLCRLSIEGHALKLEPVEWLNVKSDLYVTAAEQFARKNANTLPKGQMVVVRHMSDSPPQIVAVECCAPRNDIPRGRFELTSNDSFTTRLVPT